MVDHIKLIIGFDHNPCYPLHKYPHLSGIHIEYRHLGKSGIQVSELSFGSWVTFHNQSGLKDAVEMMEEVDRALGLC